MSKTEEVLPPLEDPTYEPVHRPYSGGVHPVVAKWGPRSQLRWFWRFRRELRPMRSAEADLYYCHSVEHRGWCCGSCMGEIEDGYGQPYDEYCCCKGYNARTAS
jgi:hypothetical protein